MRFYRGIDFGRMTLILGIAGLLCSPLPVRAQNVVVAKFTDSSKKGLGKKAQSALTRELRKAGAQLVGFPKYQRAAKKLRIPPRGRMQPEGIAQVCSQLGLTGVLTGSAAGRKGQFRVTLVFFSATGETLWERTYPLAKPMFGKPLAAEAAGEILAQIQGGGGGGGGGFGGGGG